MIGFIAKLMGGSSIGAWAVVIAAGIITAYIATLKVEIWSLEKEVGTLEINVQKLELDVAHEKGEVKACQARIEESNNRITDLKEDTVNRNNLINMLTDNIDAFRQVTDFKITAIEGTPTPASCAAAIEFLRKGAGK